MRACLPNRPPCGPTLRATPPCSQVFPDYKERVVRHEAAHFLTGYLLVRL